MSRGLPVGGVTVHRVYLRILTKDDSPEVGERIRKSVEELLSGEALSSSEFAPYWKIEGWGELNLTVDTTRDLRDIQNLLADNWESDTASADIRLPDVGFLWIGV